MFSLEKQNSKLSAFNPRSEIHGEGKVPAADIFIQIKASNDVLSEFDPQLKGALYQKADQDDIEPGHLPVFKFPKMSPFKWAKDFAGYELIVHYGVSETDNIILPDCQLDKIKFECQDGGTVLMSFRIVAHPEERACAR